MNRLLLIERDPFVRTDMEEALQSGFPDYQVDSFATFAEVQGQPPPNLILSDIAASDLSEMLAVMGWNTQNIICVLTSASRQNTSDRFVHLSRPFTEEMLINSVRTALQHINAEC